MMPTPALYTGNHAKPLFTNVAENHRTPPLDLLYITDREAAAAGGKAGPYTATRSRSLSFGSTTIEFGDAVTWDALVAQSASENRAHDIELKLGPTRELGRFPPVPYELVRTAGGLSRSPAVIAAHEAARTRLQAEIERRLSAAPRKEVVLFVHGFANSFADAALTMGDLCHFLGREFVCAIFSWPAGGSKGVFFGYDVDRESGEFATEDLKKTIRIIADTPGVQKIHLLAHSRGTDVLATAISELSIEAYISKTSLARRFKIANIVLIAPDVDIDVARAKIFTTISDPDLPYGKAPDAAVVVPPPALQLTVYVSPNDKALATSGWLFGSLARLGRFTLAMLRPGALAQSRVLRGIDVIEVTGAGCFICHDYFVSNPRVSSDLIAMLRYGLKPNEPGRPLVEIKKPFWRIPTDADVLLPH